MFLCLLALVLTVLMYIVGINHGGIRKHDFSALYQKQPFWQHLAQKTKLLV